MHHAPCIIHTTSIYHIHTSNANESAIYIFFIIFLSIFRHFCCLLSAYQNLLHIESLKTERNVERRKLQTKKKRFVPILLWWVVVRARCAIGFIAIKIYFLSVSLVHNIHYLHCLTPFEVQLIVSPLWMHFRNHSFVHERVAHTPITLLLFVIYFHLLPWFVDRLQNAFTRSSFAFQNSESLEFLIEFKSHQLMSHIFNFSFELKFECNVVSRYATGQKCDEMKIEEFQKLWVDFYAAFTVTTAVVWYAYISSWNFFCLLDVFQFFTL